MCSRVIYKHILLGRWQRLGAAGAYPNGLQASKYPAGSYLGMGRVHIGLPS